MSVNKYLIFSEDQQLIAKLKSVFSTRQLNIRSLDRFPVVDGGIKLVVIDGDGLPPEQSLSQLKKIKRENIPIVYIFTGLSGKRVMEVLKSGVISVLFKDYTADWIKSELRDILFNFNYLEKVKDIAENDHRTKQFLNVVNHLTSDNDINKIMNDILESMSDVFNLQCTVFFIAKKGALTKKIKIGGKNSDYSKVWPLNDPDIPWLKALQRKKEPIYITNDSPPGYRRDFPVNTLLMPLVIKEKFFGLISATPKPRAGKFKNNEIELLKAFSEQTAVALENAKLYWDVISAREQLIKQEKKALMNQTIISLNHEINNPLSIISMEAQLLHQRLEKNENKIESRIAKIEFNIDRIKNILEKISALNMDDHIPIDYITGKQMLNLS